VRYIPGFTHLSRGTASYRGALRATPRSAPVWTCKHDHLTAKKATECAAAEWDRREQGTREVFDLLHCIPCGSWLTGEQVNGLPGGVNMCPRCGVRPDRVKVVVVERLPS
jgi:hypothetical protein